MKKNNIVIALLLVVLVTLISVSCTTADDVVSDDTNVAEGNVTDTEDNILEVEDNVADWKVDGNTITSPKGEQLSLPEISEYYQYEIISYWPQSEVRCLVQYYESGRLELYLVDTTEGVCHLNEGQKTLDYTVAYDTVYWYNLDRTVWASSWTEDFTAQLFCEDAVAVSPFTDECEGAIVEPGRENINYGYNGLPIYSPYGIVD